MARSVLARARRQQRYAWYKVLQTGEMAACWKCHLRPLQSGRGLLTMLNGRAGVCTRGRPLPWRDSDLRL